MSQDTVSQILDNSKRRWEHIKLAFQCGLVTFNYCQNFILEEQKEDAKKIQEKFRTHDDRADPSSEKL